MTLTRGAHNSRNADAGRRTASLAGLAVTLLLVVMGLYLVDRLRTMAVLQDSVIAVR